MDAVEASLQVGTRTRAGKRSRKNAKFLRDGAVIERERRALELLRDGLTHQEIAHDLGISRSGATMLIQRALAYRAEREGPAVEEARTIHTMRLEKLLVRWYPRAVGDWYDEETGKSQHEPDYRAAEMTLKILSQMADIQGTKRTPMTAPGVTNTSSQDVHVHFHHPDDRQRAEATILDNLRKAAEKAHTIEGQLAALGTSTAQLTGHKANDKPGPPPVRT